MRRISQRHFQQELNRILVGLRHYRPQKVILFGSFARGDYHALSDCDYSIPLQPLVYTPAEFEQMRNAGNRFIEQVLQEGKAIYES